MLTSKDRNYKLVFHGNQNLPIFLKWKQPFLSVPELAEQRSVYNYVQADDWKNLGEKYSKEVLLSMNIEVEHAFLETIKASFHDDKFEEVKSSDL